MGRGMLRWAAFLRKLKPGGTFFQTWVVGRCNAGQARMQRCTNCRQAAMSRHQRRSSLAQSVTLSSPRPAEITAALSRILLALSQRTGARTLTFPASQIPSQGHIVAPDGQDREGG